MGAGKSTIGRGLARRFGLGFVDLDHAIEHSTGADIALIFEHEGEAGFRQRERRQLERASAMHCIVLACGGGIVLDPDNRALLMQRGFVVHLDIDVDQQLARLGRDRTRPLLAAPDRRRRLQTLARQRNDLYAATADLPITCRDIPIAAATDEVANHIEARWRRAPRTGATA